MAIVDHFTPQNPEAARICLYDRTSGRSELASVLDAPEAYTADESAGEEDSIIPLQKKFTAGSLSQSLRDKASRQKYRKYERDRYALDDEGALQEDPMTCTTGLSGMKSDPSYFARGRRKAGRMFKRKKRQGEGDHDRDTALDILWENQRGMFFFGVPRYSSNSLLPSDPKPWQNAQFRTSPVDIRNAQVPDPGWVWVWKTWYVDMERDVDEEGWEYSFSFKSNFNWHGSHAWLHSFVRRRRWLRFRCRKNTQLFQAIQNPHDLASEYFTIHPEQSPSTQHPNNVYPCASLDSSSPNIRHKQDVEKHDEILTIGDLMFSLRQAVVDREKLVAIRKFASNAEEELFYLSDCMTDILNHMIHPASRSQVILDLTALKNEIKQIAAVDEHRLSHRPKLPWRGHETQQDAALRCRNLERAVESAQALVPNMDFRGHPQTTRLVDSKFTYRAGPASIKIRSSGSFINEQSASAPGSGLYDRSGNKQKQLADGTVLGRTQEVVRKDQEALHSERDAAIPDNNTAAPVLERYTTAAESVSQMRD